MVLLMVLFLSLFALLLSPMSLMHYQSVLHYEESQSLEHLAYSVKERCLSEFEHEWPDSMDSGWISWNEREEYRYLVTFLDEDARTLTINVRNTQIERTFQGTLHRGSPKTSMVSMLDYALYSSKDLYLLDLSTIHAPLSTLGIACLENIKISRMEELNRLNLAIYGNIYLESTQWEYFHNSCVFQQSSIPFYDKLMVDEFIYLLKNRHGDKMAITGNDDFLSLDLDSMGLSSQVLLVEHAKQLQIRGTFSGLLIVSHCQQVVLEDATINGCLLVSGSDRLSVDRTNLLGNMTLVDSQCERPLDLHLDHQEQVLLPLRELLSMTLTRQQNAKTEVLEFKELY